MAKPLMWIGAVLLMGSAFFILWRAGLPSNSDVTVENAVPAFQAHTLDGQAMTIPTGHPLVINFWATWCIPCIVEMPMLEGLHRAGQPVIGINAGLEDQPTIETWLMQNNITLPIVLDQKRELEALFRVQGLPMTFFIDEQGMIQQVERGALTPDSLAAGLAAIGIQ